MPGSSLTGVSSVRTGRLALALPVAHAIPITFTSALNQNEVIPTGSPGTSSAVGVFDTTAHTLSIQFPEGEIRGFVQTDPHGTMPAPASLVLLGLGLMRLGFIHRRCAH